MEEGLAIPEFRSEIRSLNKLRQAAPELFIEGYSQVVQRQNHPRLIKESEISGWKSKTFTENGFEIKRNILVYHRPDGNRLYFVAPSDEIPLIGLKENTLSNKNEFPWIPCCFRYSYYTSIKNLSDEDPFHFSLWVDIISTTFVFVVFVSDGYLHVDNKYPLNIPRGKAVRFFRMLENLPMELQMVICNRLGCSMRNSITGKEFEDRYKKIADDERKKDAYDKIMNSTLGDF